MPTPLSPTTSNSFGVLRALIGAGAPDSAGAVTGVIVKNESAVSGRGRQGGVAVGDGAERVDRVGGSRLHVRSKCFGCHAERTRRIGLGDHRVPIGDKVRQLVEVLE